MLAIFIANYLKAQMDKMQLAYNAALADAKQRIQHVMAQVMSGLQHHEKYASFSSGANFRTCTFRFTSNIVIVFVMFMLAA